MISAANELAWLCAALSQALQSFKKVVLLNDRKTGGAYSKNVLEEAFSLFMK